MNREKKNKIPSMQVGFIDAVCLQLYEVWCLTKNWKYLNPELFSVVFSSCTFKLRTKFGFSILVKKIFFHIFSMVCHLVGERIILALIVCLADQCILL